ncbi:MAG: polysaccharide biosynthesis protein, partial [Bdellovibrionales bacterium]|nr:polysaccharide biosynthesis protein [Bdellovibrionales bacterium]
MLDLGRAKFINIIRRQSTRRKLILSGLFDAVVALISFPLALVIRFGSFDSNLFGFENLLDFILVVFAVKMVIFHLMRLSRGIWQFASIPDLTLIIKASSLSVLVSLGVIFFWQRAQSVPRSAFIIDWFITLAMLGGGRFYYRLLRESGRKNRGMDYINTLIIGAGSAGEQLLRELKREQTSMLHVVGFLDDDIANHYRTIHGVSVLGEISALERWVDKFNVTNIIIAIPTATSKEIRLIVSLCMQLNLEVKSLPALKDLVDGKVQVSQLRPVAIEDLLGRKPVELDQPAIGQMLTDQVIMVTGAGGSIGSELCRQILLFNPTRLILFESCELFIYRTEKELKRQFGSIGIIPVVGDVRERARVKEVLATYRPDMIFHAAAYKHVPMMEQNPHEAIKTNVMGTRIVAEESVQHSVKKFVMISTDKAVNPTNVMGATKRVAEMICQMMQQQGSTQFVTLRFGNVLGSAGSVIPHFMEQIRTGGPVTVTHPEVTRYFMSIPEATQLVLQAGSL